MNIGMLMFGTMFETRQGTGARQGTKTGETKTGETKTGDGSMSARQGTVLCLD